jgi:hypothetical protein
MTRLAGNTMTDKYEHANVKLFWCPLGYELSCSRGRISVFRLHKFLLWALNKCIATNSPEGISLLCFGGCGIFEEFFEPTRSVQAVCRLLFVVFPCLILLLGHRAGTEALP